MPVTPITSGSLLLNVEEPFRVFAGPGAGKTHWLVEHIKNVLHRSLLLAKTRKICCITYTNTACEKIISRLGGSSDRVEVSTIHSFLYKHILSPYGSFIATDFGFNYKAMEGHDDRILSNYSFLNDWKIATRQQRIQDDVALVRAFESVRWKFDATGNLVATTNYPHKIGGYSVRTASYMDYKKMCWAKGVVHHDDVLFLSFQILKKLPFVLQVLVAKFPYFFVDEFQDSNPIQVEILKQIGAAGGIVGIIGDQAQSIYGFQGASFAQFSSISLPGIQDFVIEGNRRSSNEIVSMGNSIRTDIQQVPIRNIQIAKPVLLIGDMLQALRTAKAACANEKVYTLSRNNITSNAMKKEITGTSLNGKLFQELAEADPPSAGNKYRSKITTACLKATELAREGKFKDAIRELQLESKFRSDPQKSKNEAIEHLMILLGSYDTYKDASLLDFCNFVRARIKNDISNLAAGRAKTFYEANSYQQMALCVNIPEDVSLHKTIHKAKGDEFDNVLLVLQEETDLEFILAPDLTNPSKEEQRVNYVGISRAKNRLFISVPTLNASNLTSLYVNFEITQF